MPRTTTAGPDRPSRPVGTAEAARHVGVTPRTIQRYVTRGRLTGWRVGPRLIKVDLGEVEALFRRIPAAGA
jgi:excisionase family DNA binding protein